MTTQTLSFTLRPASSIDDLQRACQVRSISYGHHLPNLADEFALPDETDLSPYTIVFLCEDKLTGEAIGTARVETTTRGCSALPIEACIELPTHMAHNGRAEITRMASLPGADPLVRLALWKAGYLYCHANQAKWLLIGARSRALAKGYQRLGATNLFADDRMVPLPYTSDMLHYILGFDVLAAERLWFEANHPLFSFMFETVHHDIQLFDVSYRAKRPVVLGPTVRAVHRNVSA
jgi:hypothetical protein